MTARTIASRPVFALLVSVVLARVASQQNHIDLVTPAAPELAAFGAHAVGVRTLAVSPSAMPSRNPTAVHFPSFSSLTGIPAIGS